MARGSTVQATQAGRGGKKTHRLLVIANETVAGKALLDEIAERVREQPAEILVVAPALVESPVKRAFGDVDEARERATERLQRSLEAIRRLGANASGWVGEADPRLAIEDALRRFDADELIISTHPPGRSNWLEQGILDTAREELEQPITHVVVDLEAESGAGQATTVEAIPSRPKRRDAQGADYLPPMPFRDRLTLVVGIVGTVSLGALALMCPDNGSFSGGCAVRGLIALGAFMFTLFHGVALIVMGSTRYRGFWNKAASNSVLYGVPLAVIVSALFD